MHRTQASSSKPLQKETAVPPRIMVNPRVRVPGGDVDIYTNRPIQYTQPYVRHHRSKRFGNEPAARKQTLRQALFGSRQKGIRLQTLLLFTSPVAIVMAIALLIQFGAAVNVSNGVISLRNSIMEVAETNKALSDELAKATNDTGVRFTASQTLGLIASQGANTIFIEIPAPRSAAAAEESVQPGAYAAILGYTE